MLGVIFKGARCEIHNPALLKQLIVNLIDKVDWLSLPVDVKGTIYEELLQRSAQESSEGAGQYFTTAAGDPDHVRGHAADTGGPHLRPAAGTGGFLFNAYNYVLDKYREGAEPRRKAGPARRAGRGHGALPEGRAACAR